MHKEETDSKVFARKRDFSFILNKFKVLGYKKTALKGGCL